MCDVFPAFLTSVKIFILEVDGAEVYFIAST